MPDPDDTEIRYSLLELGDVPPSAGPEPAQAPEPPRATIRPAMPHEEPHGPSCGLAVLVLNGQPRVICGVCHADLDPVDILRKYANRERNFNYMDEALRHKQLLLRREIDELTKIRNNLRAQVRRASEPPPQQQGRRRRS